MGESNENGEIIFRAEDGSEVIFYVIEQTMLNGSSYLLVSEDQDMSGEAYIMKDISALEDTEAIYDIVEDDEELSSIAGIFQELLEDVEIRTEDN